MHGKTRMDKSTFKICSLVTLQGKNSAYLAGIVCTLDHCILFITVSFEDWMTLKSLYQQNAVDHRVF